MTYYLSDIRKLFREDTYVTVRDCNNGNLIYHGLNNHELDNEDDLEIVGEVEATFEGAIYVPVYNG